MENEKTCEIVKPKKEINYTFKLMYVFGIMGVLIAHSQADSLGLWTELVHFASYTIALFVFVSGYFYNPKNEDKIPLYVLNKFKKLVVPLYLWQCFYGILIVLLSKAGITIGSGFTFKYFVLSPMIGKHLLEYNNPAWFIFTLFVTEILNILMRKALCKVQSNKKDVILLALSLLIGFAGVFLAFKKYNEGWWLLLTRVMYFLPFYNIGYFYKVYVEKHDKLSSFWYFLIIITIELIIILINGHTSAYSIVIMDQNYFENPVLPYLSGTLGIAFYLRIAKILTPVIGKSKTVNLIADNTFQIMMNHILGFMILKALFMIAAKYLPVLPAFDVEAFKTNMTYMYLPRGRGFPLVYIVFGLAVPIAMQKFVLFVKGLVLKLKK